MSSVINFYEQIPKKFLNQNLKRSRKKLENNKDLKNQIGKINRMLKRTQFIKQKENKIKDKLHLIIFNHKKGMKKR
jgi:tRNA C32,U32 (ribose-2'-O)-methylase TrmJ